ELLPPWELSFQFLRMDLMASFFLPIYVSAAFPPCSSSKDTGVALIDLESSCPALLPQRRNQSGLEI
ncbi:UNVERIFIED_CONTAM: hypothetical protein K2H54_069108, partial [Gekko kuhli]